MNCLHLTPSSYHFLPNYLSLPKLAFVTDVVNYLKHFLQQDAQVDLSLLKRFFSLLGLLSLASICNPTVTLEAQFLSPKSCLWVWPSNMDSSHVAHLSGKAREKKGLPSCPQILTTYLRRMFIPIYMVAFSQAC